MGTDPYDDYYSLLGIDADADSAVLRRAWRRLALRWHPDRAGHGATAIFQKLSEAYNVLSDPIARAAYDRRRGTATRGSGVRSSAAQSPPPATSGARPSAAQSPPPATPRRRAPGVMLQRLSGPLNSLIACGNARRAEADVIELFVNAREAAEGGMVTISMRVPVRCQACSPETAASCTRCGGAGSTEELFSAWLAVPPEVADGTVLIPSAQLRGMLRPVSFRVRHSDPL
jgi:molecular chaperone DnaJ